MKTVCAWCKTLIADSGGNDEVSHGICSNCLARAITKPEASLEKLLNSLSVPVLLVDKDRYVFSGNNRSLQFFVHKTNPSGSILIGDFFHCIHSETRESCGTSSNCPSCAIRMAVTETFNTGIGQNSIPAVLKSRLSKDEEDIRFLISTEKTENFVLLKIEDILK